MFFIFNLEKKSWIVCVYLSFVLFMFMFLANAKGHILDVFFKEMSRFLFI